MIPIGSSSFRHISCPCARVSKRTSTVPRLGISPLEEQPQEYYGWSASDIDDIYCNILLAHNIDILRHIVVLLLCIVEES